MLYRDSDLEDYKYLVSASDNYILLSKSRTTDGTWEHPDTIDVVYQYINPSIHYVKTTYTTSQSLSFPNVSNQLSSNIFDRADFPTIFICNFIILLIFGFILNQLTKLVLKGGVFGR